MIVLTGASGNVGGGAARLLTAAGHPIRVLVRDPARAPVLRGAEVVTADYGDAASLDNALGSGDRVFMVSMHRKPDERIELHRTFVEAAVRARVGQLVYLSFLSPSLESSFPHSRSHRATEELVRASGLPHTFLRTSLYQNALLEEFERGAMRGPGGDGRVSWVSRDDCAAVVAGVLTQPGHDGRTYDVTGPEAPTLAESAEIASEVCGATFTYEDETGGDPIKWRRAEGYSDEIVRVWTGMFEAIRAGELAPVSDIVERVVGRQPTTLHDFVAAHRDEFLSRSV